ncbi:MAG: hypothetical protein MUE94_02595 [Verrucomicrobia bacterium]|jgi:hypothetical protein|nr:hypothetical protein [Verrucomicrobiota bacterium]
MRRVLRVLAGLIGVLTLAVWLVTGAHTGWTQTRVTVVKLDPVTELEYPETRDQFVAGVEVLGGGLLLALALLGASFLLKPVSTTNRKETKP